MKEALAYEQWSSTPPLQPFISRYAESYREYQMNWNPYCVKKDALLYQFVTGNEKDKIELVPDACPNVLFELDMSNPKALLSGASLQPAVLALKPNTTYFGFKPYSNLGIKSPKVHLRDLIDSCIDFTLAFPAADRLVADMCKTDTFNERIRVFSEFAGDNLVDDSYLPTFVDYLAVIICSSNENIAFNSIGRAIGYSERHCREKFKDGYGMSPKQYSGIIRFQNALKALVSGSCEDLPSLAVECGYFDQSHFTREFRRYTNIPPDKYRKRYIRTLRADSASRRT